MFGRFATRLTSAMVSGVAVVAVAAVSAPPAWAASSTDLISRTHANHLGNCQSIDPQVSANGRLIVFTSCANNFAKHDRNASSDVFLRDREKGTLTLISHRRHSKRPSNGQSGWASISGNGRYIAYLSDSSDLVKGDHNNVNDIFRLDRKTGKTILVSRSSSGHWENDNALGQTAISDNGRYVVFASDASNLVKHDTNGARDVFLRDIANKRTYRVDVSSSGHQAASGATVDPDLSANGRYVAFTSFSTDLVSNDDNSPDIFVYDRISKKTTNVTMPMTAQHVGLSPSISANGSVVCFTTPESNDYVVHLHVGGAIPPPSPSSYEEVSVASDGTPGNADSEPCAVNRQGTKVAFGSRSTNLVTGDSNSTTDVFVHTLGGGPTRRVSVSSGGAQGNDASPAFGGTNRVDLSKSGNTIVFDSAASNFAKHDHNTAADVFVRIR